jgi:hypothetical protein
VKPIIRIAIAISVIVFSSGNVPAALVDPQAPDPSAATALPAFDPNNAGLFSPIDINLAATQVGPNAECSAPSQDAPETCTGLLPLAPGSALSAVTGFTLDTFEPLSSTSAPQ